MTLISIQNNIGISRKMKHINYAPNEIDIKKFKRNKRMSRGGFGVVYKVEEKATGNLYAAKIIDCGDDEEQCNKIIEREVGIMISAKHPTIIKFIGYSKLDFQDENNIVIIMELAKNGSLADALKKIQESDGPKNYTNTIRQIILVGVARGMKYLHDRNIIHRDLKPGNILLDENLYPHITDFGMSKIFEPGHSYSQSQFGGTLSYIAPEIFLNERYGTKVDVYSFGILMYEVLTDSVPYPDLINGLLPDHKFRSKVIDDDYRPEFKYPIKKSFRQLIEKCWSKNPDQRPTFEYIFNKLANRNNAENDDDDDDFLLDDVDMNEFNIYVEDISEVTDTTDKLLSKIEAVEKENKKLKAEVDKLKSDNKKYLDIIESYKKENQQLKEENKKLKSTKRNDSVIRKTIAYNISIPSVNNHGVIDVCFVLDCTSSMQSIFHNAIEIINDTAIELKICNRKTKFNFGAVILRDPVDYVDIEDSPINPKYQKVFDNFIANKKQQVKKEMIAYDLWDDDIEIKKERQKSNFDRKKYPINANASIQFTNDIENVIMELSKVECSGGNDEPEDWAGSLVCALRDLEWRHNSEKYIVFITDSNAHGKRFCGYDNHNEEEPILTHLIQQLATNKYYFCGINVLVDNDKEGCKRTLNEVKKIYNENAHYYFKAVDTTFTLTHDYWPYDSVYEFEENFSDFFVHLSEARVKSDLRTFNFD